MEPLEETEEFSAHVANEKIILAKNLVKDYEIGEFIIRAIDDVSLEVKRGDIAKNIYLCVSWSPISGMNKAVRDDFYPVFESE